MPNNYLKLPFLSVKPVCQGTHNIVMSMQKQFSHTNSVWYSFLTLFDCLSCNGVFYLLTSENHCLWKCLFCILYTVYFMLSIIILHIYIMFSSFMHAKVTFEQIMYTFILSFVTLIQGLPLSHFLRQKLSFSLELWGSFVIAKCRKISKFFLQKLLIGFL